MKHFLKPLLASAAIALLSCQPDGPQAVNYGKDQCDHCQMTVTDPNYAAELITDKGRVYKFDDIACMLDYKEQNADKTQNAKLYVADFETKVLIPAEGATFIKGGELKSPMGGNTAAFADKEKATAYAQKIGAEVQHGLPINQNHSEHQGHHH